MPAPRVAGIVFRIFILLETIALVSLAPARSQEKDEGAPPRGRDALPPGSPIDPEEMIPEDQEESGQTVKELKPRKDGVRDRIQSPGDDKVQVQIPNPDRDDLPDLTSPEQGPAQSLDLRTLPTDEHPSWKLADASPRSKKEMEEMEEGILSMDDLVDLDIEILTSGRQPTKLRGVPESIFVITREEIESSGVTTLPQLMRLVPGMDVSQLSETHYDVDLRDHEEINPTQLLLLVDSKPVYLSTNSWTLWAGAPVVLANIERIEVVKGPGSTLYGSNALKGIVNIITRKPEKKTLSLRLQGGPQVDRDVATRWGNVYTSGLWMDSWGKLGASLAASYLRLDTWESGIYPQTGIAYRATENFTGNVTATWKPAQSIALTFRGDTTWSKGDEHFLTRSPGEMLTLGGELLYEHGSLLLEADRLDLKIQTRTYNLSATVPLDPRIEPMKQDFDETSATASLLYRFPLADRFTTSIGIEEQALFFDAGFLKKGVDHVSFLSAFLQEKIRVLESLSVTGGVRFERQFQDEATDNLILGQGSAVYSPSERHTFRFTAGQGYKNPALLYRFAHYTIFDGAIALLDEDNTVKPERLTSLELGYQLNLSHRFKLDTTLYHSWLSDNIHSRINSLPPLIKYYNSADTTHLYGAELMTTWAPRDWILVRLAYALNLTDHPFYKDVPQNAFHKVYGTLWLRPTDRLDVNLTLYLASFTSRSTSFGNEDAILNPISVLDLRVAYAFWPWLRALLCGNNLLDIRWGDTFRDGALDTEHATDGVERIGTRIWLGVEIGLDL